MFRPLEAIFSLHKIELEERDIIHIVCARAYQWWDLSIITCWASIFKSTIYVQGRSSGWVLRCKGGMRPRVWGGMPQFGGMHVAHQRGWLFLKKNILT